MKLYLVKADFPFFVSKQDEAKRNARDLKCEWELVEVPTIYGREALAAFLNTLGGPATVRVAGDPEEDRVNDSIERERRPQPGYTERSIQLDDDFDKLPLARQLDLAARAMENARDKIPG
jgi:hypothetical protein